MEITDEHLTVADVVIMSDILRETRTLEKLYLINSDISDDHIIALSNGLKVNSTVELLCMTKNKIGDKGMAALAHAVRRNKTLQELYLSMNEIGDAGLIDLSRELKKWYHKLRMLHLTDNQISNRGANALAECLKENCALKEIYLFRNHIDDEGAIALLEGLQENFTLAWLDLEFNNISQEVTDAIRGSMRMTPKTRITQAADNGNLNAQFRCGLMHDVFSNATAQNVARACHWYRFAAGRGHAKAQFQLGCLLERDGVRQNRTLAQEFFHASAVQGHVDAIYWTMVRHLLMDSNGSE